MQSLPRNGAIRLAEKERLALAEGDFVTFRGARGALLECTEGMLWITVEGQPGDFLITAGERLAIESNGLVLVEGVPCGALRRIREAPWPIAWANRVLSSLA